MNDSVVVGIVERYVCEPGRLREELKRWVRRHGDNAVLGDEEQGGEEIVDRHARLVDLESLVELHEKYGPVDEAEGGDGIGKLVH